jgi:hypothetical protein
MAKKVIKALRAVVTGAPNTPGNRARLRKFFQDWEALVEKREREKNEQHQHDAKESGADTGNVPRA